MTRLFFFSNPAKNYSEIYNFITKLVYHSNSKRVVNERFMHLIQDVNAEITNKKVHLKLNHTISQELELQENKNLEKQKRKSYLVPGDLYQDLLECECEEVFSIKSGFAIVTPEKFKINT